jgi:peptidoglycan/LPS O-acetylase OafA/YrhL
MLTKAEDGAGSAERIVPLDRARTFIIFLVVLYHSVINYTYYGIGGDRMRWLGFDLVVLFCDSFFMACVFFISGLFVHGSLARRGAANFFASRAWRLGIPFLASIFLLMPIAYYRYYVAQFDFAHFYWHMVSVGPWSAGSSWFLWVLLAFDAIAIALLALAAGVLRGLGQRVSALSDRPFAILIAFVIFTVLIYLPMHLIFGDSSWIEPGHYPFPLQTSRILLYAGYFLCGVAVGSAGLKAGLLSEGGAFARRWATWLACALVCYGAILCLVYVHRSGLVDLRAPPLWWHTAYGVAFATFAAAMTFAIPATFLRFAKSRLSLLDAMQKQAYGIYLVHFIPLIWLQYLVYDPPWPAFVKFAIVFIGTLFASWGLTLLLRKNPVLARMI